MSDLSAYVSRSRESLYFSGAAIDRHLGGFLASNHDTLRRLGQDIRSARHIYFVGSGGSFASLQTAKYLFDRTASVPSDVLMSYELLWRQPVRLDEDAVVILASYSGDTEDTVAAMHRAQQAGATTIGLIGRADSTIGRAVDHLVAYENGAIYEIPIAAVVLLAAGMSEGLPEAQAAEGLALALEAVPGLARHAVDREADQAERRGRDILKMSHIFVLGSGPLGPLAYKQAMSVIMENIRIGGTFSDASEWRHGPAEALERLRPNVIALIGTDESRDVTLRAVEFTEGQGANVMRFDATEFGPVHPLLTPLVMNPVLQWMVVWSAILRGITDLDERVFMGHNVLATVGRSWP